MQDKIQFKYVIGFPVLSGKVLMIKRNKRPWVNKWNGAGGKIQEGEKPLEAYYREMKEETGLELDQVASTRYVGVVTWDINKEGNPNNGMYTFISEISSQHKVLEEDRVINEGIIGWKNLEWVINKTNNEVADNIPYFLPLMISSEKPRGYHCVFDNGVLKDVEVFPLGTSLSTFS